MTVGIRYICPSCGLEFVGGPAVIRAHFLVRCMITAMKSSEQDVSFRDQISQARAQGFQDVPMLLTRSCGLQSDDAEWREETLMSVQAMNKEEEVAARKRKAKQVLRSIVHGGGLQDDCFHGR